ncbi:MAG: alkaline phosphatase family protein [Dehalococcoidia bacterium]
MKILLVIFDGLGDRPSPHLKGLTPLEAAPTPNLDRLAAAGANGQFWALDPWVPAGTAMAHHVIFGYAEHEFADRAVLMALARGYPPEPGDVVLAARFASGWVEDGTYRLRERFIRDAEAECSELAEAIGSWESDGLRFSYRYCGRGDGLLTIAGGACADITDSDPLGLDLPVIEVEPLEAARDRDGAERTAKALNEYLGWAHETLQSHPVNEARALAINLVITKWAGSLTPLEPFLERHGVRAAGIPGEEIVDGVQRAVGMDVFKVERAADPESDLHGRLTLAFELFDRGYDFVNVHTKEPDATGHWTDPGRKRDVIAALDRGLGEFMRALEKDDDLVVLVTGDHCTPSSWDGIAVGGFNDQHSGEPVPLLLRGRHALVDSVSSFGERAAAAGVLGRVLGKEMMQMLLVYADRTNVAGVRPTPRARPYRPTKVKALKPGRD